jgi:putative sterol carrier protein
VTRDELFSESWAAALERELAGDAEYRRAAASWHGSLLFVLEEDPALGLDGGRVLFLDLAHGNARALRPALDGDERAARYRLAAPAAIWVELLEGDLEAGTALMSGRVRLEKGSLFSLFPHLEAARCLLAAARRVGAGSLGADETSGTEKTGRRGALR